MPPADCTFDLVIDKGDQDCVMYSLDLIKRRMNMYRDKVERVLRLGDLEDEDRRQLQQQSGGGEGWYNDDAVNGKKYDKEGQEEVVNDNGGEEK